MMGQENTDETLLFHIRRSDVKAFTELYQRYWGQLYTSALKRMGSEDDAKDIIQELFFKLWMRRHSIPEDARVAEYLYTALRYRIINYLQAGQVRLKYAHACVAEQDQSTVSLAESKLALEGLESFVRRTVRAMPGRMQQIFILSFKYGYSCQEIAKQLSLTEQTVKNHLSKARSILKERMRDQHPALNPK